MSQSSILNTEIWSFEILFLLEWFNKSGENNEIECCHRSLFPASHSLNWIEESEDTSQFFQRLEEIVFLWTKFYVSSLNGKVFRKTNVTWNNWKRGRMFVFIINRTRRFQNRPSHCLTRSVSRWTIEIIRFHLVSLGNHDQQTWKPVSISFAVSKWISVFSLSIKKVSVLLFFFFNVHLFQSMPRESWKLSIQCNQRENRRERKKRHER